MSKNSLKDIISSEYQECAKNASYFMKKYCMIQHPTQGRIPFRLYDFQERVLHDFMKHQYNIILKSRQLGISTLCAGYSLWLMLFHEDKNVLVIATKQEVAKTLITKIREMHTNLPSWLRSISIEDNKLSLRLKNGSQIKALPATPDAGRSLSLSLLIIDECAHIDKIEEIWGASQQTLADGGQAILLSTPLGQGNFFHKTWIGAENFENKFNPIKLKWDVHPDRDKKWRDDQNILLGDKLASQECDADFVSSGNTVIESDIIQWYEQTYIQDPIEKRGIEGNFWIWEQPNYSRDYIVVADVSRGDGSDYSAFHIIDVETVTQVAEYKGKISTKDFGNFLVSIATEYNDALLVIENANVGWAAIQPAIDRNYKNLYYSYKDTGVADIDIYMNNGYDLKDKSLMIPGFSTTSKNRPLIVSKLDMYFREKACIIRSKRTINELSVFIWNGYRPEAQRGYNDDLIISLSIGLYVRDTALKLRQHGIELNKKALDYMKSSLSNQGIYTPNINDKKTWQMNVKGNDEDIRWLL